MMAKKVLILVLLVNAASLLQAQHGEWRPIGPWGGKVDDIVIAPSQTGTLYALQRDEVLKSNDYGRHWHQTTALHTTDVQPLDMQVRLSVAPNDPTRVFVGGAAALRQSSDGGDTWAITIDSLGFIFDQVLFVSGSTTLYTNTLDRTIEDDIAGGGIFRSFDDGENWHLMQTPFNTRSVVDFDISPADTTHLFALVHENLSIFRSENAGQTWSEINTGISSPLTQLEISPDNPAKAYASFLDKTTGTNGLVVSPDSGLNWTVLNTDFPPGRIHNFAINPADERRIFVTASRGLFLSVDAGMHWQRIDNTIQDSVFFDIEIDGVSDTIYAAAEVFGVYASENSGADWQKRNGNMNGLGGPFTVNPQDINEVYLAHRTGILQTKNGGTSWSRGVELQSSDNNLTVAIAPSDPNTIYASGRAPGKNRIILRSSDGGQNWLSFPDSSLPDGDLGFTVTPANPNIVFSHSELGIFKSTDAGHTWISQSNGLSSSEGSTIPVNWLEFNPLNPKSIFAATKSGIFKSINSGENWSRVGEDTTELASIKLAQTDTLLIFASTPYSLTACNGRLRTSVDGGHNWQTLPSPEELQVVDFAINPKDPNLIWTIAFDELNLESYVFVSQDAGLTWRRTNNGLPDGFKTGTRVIASNGLHLFLLADFERGIYRMDWVTSAKSRKTKVPTSFRLLPNYPNPFSASEDKFRTEGGGTTIQYEVFQPGNIELSVYNILGQRIRILVTQHQARGRYVIRWDGKNKTGEFVSPGIYFISLKGATDSKTQKVLLLP